MNSNLVQQHVVQLQVSIDDAAIVQVEEADGDLGGVETGKNEEKEMSKPLCSFCVCMWAGTWTPLVHYLSFVLYFYLDSAISLFPSQRRTGSGL